MSDVIQCIIIQRRADEKRKMSGSGLTAIIFMKLFFLMNSNALIADVYSLGDGWLWFLAVYNVLGLSACLTAVTKLLNHYCMSTIYRCDDNLLCPIGVCTQINSISLYVYE